MKLPFSVAPSVMWLPIAMAAAIYLPCEMRAKTSTECDGRVTSALAVLGIGGGAMAGSQLGYQRGFWTLNPKLRGGEETEPVAPRGLLDPPAEPPSPAETSSDSPPEPTPTGPTLPALPRRRRKIPK